MTTNTYDSHGNLKSVTTPQPDANTPASLTSYHYDAASNRDSFTAPDNSTIAYVYDTLNRLQTLTSSFAGQFAFGYDVLNRRTSLARPNGVTTGYTYDSMSNLLSVLHQLNGSLIDGLNYQYDDVGNRTGSTPPNGRFTYGYGHDELNQLVSVLRQPTNPDDKAPMTYTERYTYDAVGNRLSSINLSSYLYNSSNQLTTTPAATYTYDDNGNTISKSETAGTTSYAWDFENRLRSVTLPSNAGTVSFSYDPFGRRISKTSATATTIYLYDGGNVVEEMDGAGTLTARYVQGEGIDEPLALNSSGLFFYQADGLGSITSLTDSTGVAIATYTYDSFGNLTDSSGTMANPYRYTAREYDPETGLYYYRARYYDASTGRFVNEDPIGFDAGVNFYSYARNNPITFTDPSGMDVWLEGPSGHEPQGHLSINVGDPNGHYDSYSFGAIFGDPRLGGEVYKDTTLGGEILSGYYLKTSPDEDARVRDILEQKLGQKAPYRPWRTCRNFSENEFDKIKQLGIGTPATPPTRPKAPGSKPWIVPSTSSTSAWDKLNAEVLFWLTYVGPIGVP